MSTLAPTSLRASLRQHGHLLRQICRRDIASRYRGSLLGMVWALVTPLLMLAIYTFVFSVVFKAKWGAYLPNQENTISFAVLLYSGLIVHQFLAEVISRSTNIILEHANFVKKVVFPLELLPFMIIHTALFMFLIQLSVLFAAMAFLGHTFHATILLVPVVMLPLVVLMLGCSWILASVGVFIRDLSQIIGLLVTVLMFLCPIFYPITAIPESFRIYIYLNPLTPIIEQMREVVLYGVIPGWKLWGAYMGLSTVIAWLGYWWFRRTRKGFNDIL